MPYKIMIVDDEPANLRLLERLFRRDYQVIMATSGLEALQLLNQHDIALLMTDQRMPGMSGIELLKRTAEVRPHVVRIILTGYTDVGELVEAINCGQVYKYVTKPWNNDDLRQTVGRALEHYETSKSRYELEQTNKRLSARLQEMTQGIVRTITDALEAKDEHIYGHARRVSGYATAIGRRMRLRSEMLEPLSLAALLHDIGKIGTPDSILLKPAALTEEEQVIMRLHSERGARMFTGMPEMDEIARFVRHHHEHFDGSGYPQGLQGEQIPLASRIILVADAYDAMTSPRPFRKAWKHEEAIERLKSEAGSQFDPEVVQAFCGLDALATIRQEIELGSGVKRLSPPPPPHLIQTMPLSGLIREVESDPILAFSVLRTSNALYEQSPAINLHAACDRLGEMRLRSVLITYSPHDELDDNSRLLLEHSLRCAEAARLLAEQTAIIDAHDAYTLGLLHDIGEALLYSLFPREMGNILWLSDEARINREVAAFGVDHAQVGQWMFESCGIPRHLTAAVQTHHDALRINAPIALLLHVANVIARAKDPQELAAFDSLGSDRLTMLGLSRSVLARIQERTTAAIDRHLAAPC